MIIINKDINLNMISYQYDYNHIKQNYQILMNTIYFINLLVPLFNKQFHFILSFDNDNHYKVHFNNFKISLINYLKFTPFRFNSLINIFDIKFLI